MPHNITIFADDDIIDALEHFLKAFYPSFRIGHKASSYQDCLEPSIQNKADIFILQAKSPVTHVDDLLFALQCAGFSPVYVLFQVFAPGKIRYATTTFTNPLAIKVNEIFNNAVKGIFMCEHLSFRTTLLNDDVCSSAESSARHESLLEILRGCNQQEFLFYREKYGLNLKGNGYYLFFWELMGVEFTDHESNKFIYNFSGEMLLRECYDIINQYNGGEVFYSTPNLLCIILNDLDIRSEAGKRVKFEEMVRKLAFCTGNKVACRYLSARVDDIKSLRYAYQKYHSEKSLSFFLRDMSVIRPALIEEQKRYTDVKTINTLLHEITDYLCYDLLNPSLEAELYMLYFDILKPAMSFTLYYSSIAAVYNAMAEVQYSFDDIMPVVNNSPNLLQFSSIEEQYDILLERIQELRSTRMRRMSSAVVLKAMNYISEHYAQDISIMDVSKALFVSNGHLSQVFKREMGMSVIKYLINYRIEQAKKFLRETEEFIYTISENIGYHDFRHFSRTFKEITGLSPTEYRKQYRLNS
ncbi:Helix-turn-helix domain-containing protein [Sporobacter termitidis DSM 10068]|uniref:Helix-turn-helix domain-containing protein n=1 Tax=Sporobacter termitidis DSM 10068 TaxID=1123282 RepID=A0A1M5YRJ5_9FIRM|nr:AraC family transcriptional regulator [Sporobacter termitidis]SHI14478.1 Helix-turn-helix domain-containing protein [Sporobacter termitidis DSM 10068]